MQIKLNTYIEPTFGNPKFLVIRHPRGPVMSDYRDSTVYKIIWKKSTEVQNHKNTNKRRIKENFDLKQAVSFDEDTHKHFVKMEQQ